MLTVNGHLKRLCNGMSRRDLIKVAGTGFAAANLPSSSWADSASKKADKRTLAPRATIPLIPSYARIELMARQEIHELSEDESAGFHESSSAVSRKVPEADLDESTRYRARPKIIITDY